MSNQNYFKNWVLQCIIWTFIIGIPAILFFFFTSIGIGAHVEEYGYFDDRPVVLIIGISLFVWILGLGIITLYNYLKENDISLTAVC